MESFEKLGVFYLGKTKSDNGLLLYDSKDLVTHAVCVGMTGSGKTGLCINLLEEAAIDGIPAIIIDPKGDLCNLLLTFPNLTAQDFAPWVEEGVDAAQQAQLWKDGLAKWGEDGERIKRLQDAADFRIYTPGSNAGLPVSILKSFVAPPETIRQDNEALAERINTTVTSLLALIGIDADPVRSREHILLSNILNHEWSAGKDLDIGGLQSTAISARRNVKAQALETVTRWNALELRLATLLANHRDKFPTGPGKLKHPRVVAVLLARWAKLSPDDPLNLEFTAAANMLKLTDAHRRALKAAGATDLKTIARALKAAEVIERYNQDLGRRPRELRVGQAARGANPLPPIDFPLPVKLATEIATLIGETLFGGDEGLKPKRPRRR